MLINYNSPAHYLNANEINILAQPLIRMYEGTKTQVFLSTYFPKVSKTLDDFLSMKFIKPAEENIIIRNKIIFSSDLKKLEDILNNINVNKDSFEKKIASLPKCFPNVETSLKFYLEDIYINKTELNKTKMGKKFIKLRKKIKELFLSRRAFLTSQEQEINRIKTEQEIKKLEAKKNKKKEDIESFYNKFSQYYTDKNLASLMSLISDDWESSSDGITLMDLEDTLDNSFSIFDEIKCDINSLNINSIGQNKYSVTYVITIKGFIYDEDIEHTEKSSVNEEIIIDNGTPKIFKTLSGKYWKTR